MDLSQTKLTKEEWDALEVPINGREFDIIKMINRSGNDVNIFMKNTQTFLDFIKVSSNVENYHYYIFENYFKKIILRINKKQDIFTYDFKTKKTKNNELKNADKIKLKNFDKKIEKIKCKIFEYNILNILSSLFKSEKKANYVYLLNYLMNLKMTNFNIFIKCYIDKVLDYYKTNLIKSDYVKHFSKIMKMTQKYEHQKCIKLYDHQKHIITTCSRPSSKLVLYQAPTGTGKTLTPLALVKKHKIIFVCAAKHIGLQLAKCCISLQIPIAVAFGCKDPSDIRLHYFAAKEKIRNRRTGGIFRVDNSVGDLVEIIISDVQSYLPSMYYMCAFNKKEDLLWYWDEPTISLDQETHEFHSILQNNWKKNIIPNVILSSATLPKEDELTDFIMGFNNKFPTMKVYNIVSSDYAKTIPIVNSQGYAILPHNVFESYDKIKQCVSHIENYKTILRHFDIKKICEFLLHIHKNKYINDLCKIDNYFESVDDINTNTLKTYYLFVLKRLKKNYEKVFKHFKKKREKMYESCIKITTEDASTLTNGPTIFLTDNVNKLAMFYLKVSKISNSVLEPIFKIIEENRVVIKTMSDLEKEETQRLEKLGSNIKEKDHSKNLNSTEFKFQEIYMKKMKHLGNMMKKVSLPKIYIPNSEEHQRKWNCENIDAFTSDIDDDIVEKIMFLEKASAESKILLMMGIGVFSQSNCVEYKEIMKKLAQDQKLYLIIASSDYIYGTNYQFCHGYLSKDLGNISQEKMIQAFGRVGRSSMQKMYTIRLRNDDLIRKLFMKETNKPEVENMNKLFV
jgi:hypothetical protein